MTDPEQERQDWGEWNSPRQQREWPAWAIFTVILTLFIIGIAIAIQTP